MAFTTKPLGVDRDAVAPDGSDVRLLASVAAGEMWRRQGTQEEVTLVERGISLTIPLGTHFQFRTIGTEPLAAIGVTMPLWPGEGEAREVPGVWEPHLGELTRG